MKGKHCNGNRQLLNLTDGATSLVTPHFGGGGSFYFYQHTAAAAAGSVDLCPFFPLLKAYFDFDINRKHDSFLSRRAGFYPLFKVL